MTTSAISLRTTLITAQTSMQESVEKDLLSTNWQTNMRCSQSPLIPIMVSLKSKSPMKNKPSLNKNSQEYLLPTRKHLKLPKTISIRNSGLKGGRMKLSAMIFRLSEMLLPGQLLPTGDTMKT